MSDLRHDLRRQWRADQKNLNRSIKWQKWTPQTFDKVKAAIRRNAARRRRLNAG